MTTSIRHRVRDLAWLLDPIDKDHFFKEYWERRLLHIPRRSPDYFSDLFGMARFEHAMMRAKVFEKDLVMVKDGVHAKKDTYVVGNIPRMSTVYQGFAEGQTLFLYEIHRTDDQVRALCRNLEDELRLVSRPAAFLSPPNAKGTKAHYDVPNLFVVQIEGAKTWRLYAPRFEKPFRQDDVQTVPEDLGEPDHEILMQAGDVLYIPRGYIHEPYTNTQHSLHLTLGFNVPVWLNMLDAVVAKMHTGHPRFREALPLRQEGVAMETQAAHFKDLVTEMLDAVDFEALYASIWDQYLDRAQPIPDGHLAQMIRLHTLDADTLVEKRNHMLSRVHWVDEFKAALSFSGGQITGSPFLEPTMQAVHAAEGPFRARDLDGGLNEASRVTLVRRLVKCGMLRMVDAET